MSKICLICCLKYCLLNDLPEQAAAPGCLCVEEFYCRPLWRAELVCPPSGDSPLLSLSSPPVFFFQAFLEILKSAIAKKQAHNIRPVPTGSETPGAKKVTAPSVFGVTVLLNSSSLTLVESSLLLTRQWSVSISSN